MSDFYNRASSAISSFGNVGASSAPSSSSAAASISRNGAKWAVNWNLQKMALVLMFVALIIALISMAFLLWKANASMQWPPTYGDCPDHWVMNEAGVCVDAHELTQKKGANGYRTMDFSGDTYKGNKGLCAKQSWAKGQNYIGMQNGSGIAWDGIDINTNPNLCRR